MIALNKAARVLVFLSNFIGKNSFDDQQTFPTTFMKKINLIITFILLCIECSAQKIIYSDFEKEDFNRFRFNVIAKHNDKILVYKAIYLRSGEEVSLRIIL
jgi:hypothetical protein